MSEELKPLDCPFCGRSNLAVVMSDDLDFIRVECFWCGARGPESDTYEGAIKAWNTRASDSRRCENCDHWHGPFLDTDALSYCGPLGINCDADFFCADFTKRGE